MLLRKVNRRTLGPLLCETLGRVRFLPLYDPAKAAIIWVARVSAKSFSIFHFPPFLFSLPRQQATATFPLLIWWYSQQQFPPPLPQSPFSLFLPLPNYYCCCFCLLNTHEHLSWSCDQLKLHLSVKRERGGGEKGMREIRCCSYSNSSNFFELDSSIWLTDCLSVWLVEVHRVGRKKDTSFI